MPLAMGVVLRNRYRITRFLAQGEMGAVYQAWDGQSKKFCALKEYYDNSPIAQRQLAEMFAQLSGLSHPNLPKVTDSFIVPELGMYLVMDFVEGEDLRQKLLNAGGSLPETQVMPWIAQVCDALTCLHNQTPPILHGGLKPANIRITPAGRAVLVDLGTMKPQNTAARAEAVRSTSRLGPLAELVSPSQLAIAGDGVRGEIYMLGALLYTLLTGKMLPEQPEDSEDRQSTKPFSPALSRRSNAVIERATRRDRSARYASAAEFKDALGTMAVPASLAADLLAAQRPTDAKSPGAGQPTATPRRSPWLAILLITVSVVIVLAGVLVAWVRPRLGGGASPTEIGLVQNVTGAPAFTATSVPTATFTSLPDTATATWTPLPSATPTLPQPTATPTTVAATPVPSTATIPPTPAVSPTPLTALSGSFALKAHKTGVNAVAYSPDGVFLASGSQDGQVILWDAYTGATLRTLEGHTDSVNSLAFSPDGALLASGSTDTSIILWDVKSGEKLRTLSGHRKAVTSVAFSPDGKNLAAASQDSTLTVWQVDTGDLVNTLVASISQKLASGFSHVLYSPDGRLLVAGSVGGVPEWNAQRLFQAGMINGNAMAIAFSPDGKKLAAGSSTGAVSLFTMPTGDYQKSLYKHRKPVTDLVFTADGFRLLSAAQDGLIILWNVKSGEILHTFEGHTDAVNDLALAPDGKTFVSASSDGTLILWALTP